MSKKEKSQVEDVSEVEIREIAQSPKPQWRVQSPSVDINMDLEGEDLTQYDKRETAEIYNDENQNHTKNY